MRFSSIDWRKDITCKNTGRKGHGLIQFLISINNIHVIYFDFNIFIVPWNIGVGKVNDIFAKQSSLKIVRIDYNIGQCVDIAMSYLTNRHVGGSKKRQNEHPVQYKVEGMNPVSWF